MKCHLVVALAETVIHHFEENMQEQINPLERLYNLLEDSQWWPQHCLFEMQQIQLAELVTHARASSPFYKTRLDCLYRPNGTINWDRWTDVPIMTRQQLSFEQASIQSTMPVQEHGPFGSVQTSGSTGDPVKFLTTRILNDLSVTSLWRSQKWAKMDWSSSLINIGIESPRWKDGDVMGSWGPHWLKDAAKGKRIFATYATTPDDRVDLIKKYDADYAAFTNGVSLSFVEHVRDNQIPVSLKAVQFIGGTATDYLRKNFLEYLKADIFELYSSKEGGSIAHPCPLGHGWHQNAESVLLEIVDDNGKPVAPGETGRVIITPFGNTITPLIRYDQGDLAVAGPTEICPCGRTLPRIAEFSGRIRHRLTKPNGEIIYDLPIEMRQQLGAGIWQVARVAEHSYEVRYKKRDWGTKPNIEEFRKSFIKHFYPEAELRIIEVDRFVLGPTGKHLERLDEWNPSVWLG